ncbi:DUF5979 domain-containing protein [Salinibacterium sp. ZJ77]|uniref:DUF5979 domain-containing protein n=1 Tax=Salinibacterium sp. ZJ77 TaxID=2708337 RepID=UPI00141DCAF3|nr:DUF5979 domain-containing protein [Salinibacterium sp. ZJ77]
MLAVTLFVTTFVATSAPTAIAEAAGATDGTVSGMVFQSFDASGWQHITTSESPLQSSAPVAGVTVTAYDAVGDAVGTATSATNGSYTITVADAYSGDLRIEFTGWPSHLEPGFAAQGSAPAAGAAANDTSVQFVTLASTRVTGVDFALIDPDLVITGDVQLASAIQWAGNTTANSKELAALTAYPWVAQGAAPVPPGTTVSSNTINTAAAVLGQFGGAQSDGSDALGSMWGVAYSKSTNAVISSAVLRRMSGLGVLGLGGIYRTSDALLPSGALRSGALAQPWFTVQGLRVANGAFGEEVDVGTAPSNTERGLGNSNEAARDTTVFANVARVGIGGIATSHSGDTLYFTNLRDKQIYALDISDPTEAPTEATRISSGVSGTQAVWALTSHQDRLYIGYVDTGDNAAGDRPNLAASDPAVRMRAYVTSASFDELQTGTPTWRSELSIDLGYRKGSNIPKATHTGGTLVVAQDRFQRTLRWNTWTDIWAWDASKEHTGSVGIPTKTSDAKLTGLQHYSQPILSGLAFDRDGYLTLGLMDRNSLQSGNRSLPAHAASTLWSAITSGDLLVASPSAVGGAGCTVATVGERYALECAGQVGDRAVRTTAVGAQKPTNANSQGPGRGEFYNDFLDQGRSSNPDGSTSAHDEIALGAVVAHAGLKNVASTVMDPLEAILTTGLSWFDERNGTQTRGFEITASAQTGGSQSFQKAGNLGGVALLALAAPVEIGNRVWLDADLNGRQDADEPAINGARVELWTVDAQGEAEHLVGARTTTTIDGQPGTYYFRSDDPDVALGEATHPFIENASYVLRFLPGASFALAGPNADHPGFADLAWADLTRTTQTATGASSAHDSDPDVATGFAPADVGGPGENDHTFDSGWTATNVYELEKSFDPADTVVDADDTFVFRVVEATNFRGEDRLTGGGSDPQVTEVTMTLTGADLTWRGTVELPIGYRLVLAEDGATAESITWSNPRAGDSTRGEALIIPRAGAARVAKVTAWNGLGRFSVIKTVSGDGAELIPENTRFQLEYTIAGGAVQTAWVSREEPFGLQLPLGTAVTIREADPIVTDPVVSTVSWAAPAWTVGPGVTGPDADGWLAFTVEETADHVLALDNNVTRDPGGFSVTKTVSGTGSSLVPASTRFPLEYTIDGGALQTAWVSQNAPFSSGELGVGTVVQIREASPIVTDPVVTGVDWGTPTWAPTAGVTGPDSDGWYSFTIDGSTVLSLALDNTAEPIPGAFSVIKTVTGTGVGLVPENTRFKLLYTVDGGAEQTAWVSRTAPFSSGELAPGSLVRIREASPIVTDPVVPGVSWGTPVWAATPGVTGPDDGWYSFEINADEQLTLGLENRVTELDGGFTVVKTVAGAAAADIPSSTEFQIEYTIAGGPVQTARVSEDAPFTRDGLAIGTVVTIRETVPILTFPTVTGIEWGTPTWASTPGLSGPNVDGWRSFTIAATNLDMTLALRNTAEQKLLGFSILKTRAAGAALPNLGFGFEYKVGATGTPLTLGPIRAGSTASTPENIREGSTVFVREVLPTSTPRLVWDEPVWSGLPAGAVGPDADGWYSFVLAESSDPLTLTASNTSTENGDFSITKRVVMTGAPDVADAEFTVRYRLADAPAAGLEPVFGTTQSVTLTAGQTWTLPSLVPVGTVVELSEMQPANTADVVWGTPTWTINGVAASVVDGWTRFTISTYATTFAAEVTNPSIEPGGFSLRKALDGTGASTVRGLDYPVQVQIDGGTITTVQLSGDGSVWTHPAELPVGTEIRVREVTPLPVVAGIEWGDPVWSSDTATDFSVDADGWATFSVPSGRVAAAMTVTNEPILLGGFQLSKTITGIGDIRIPDDTVFHFRYSVDGGPEQAITATPATASRVVDDLRVGSIVSIREVDFPRVGRGIEFAPSPFWSFNGERRGSASLFTFEIVDGDLVDLSADNTATLADTGVDSLAERLVLASVIAAIGALLMLAARPSQRSRGRHVRV